MKNLLTKTNQRLYKSFGGPNSVRHIWNRSISSNRHQPHTAGCHVCCYWHQLVLQKQKEVQNSRTNNGNRPCFAHNNVSCGNVAVVYRRLQLLHRIHLRFRSPNNVDSRGSRSNNTDSGTVFGCNMGTASIQRCGVQQTKTDNGRHSSALAYIIGLRNSVVHSLLHITKPPNRTLLRKNSASIPSCLLYTSDAADE